MFNCFLQHLPIDLFNYFCDIPKIHENIFHRMLIIKHSVFQGKKIFFPEPPCPFFIWSKLRKMSKKSSFLRKSRSILYTFAIDSAETCARGSLYFIIYIRSTVCISNGCTVSSNAQGTSTRPSKKPSKDA